MPSEIKSPLQAFVMKMVSVKNLALHLVFFSNKESKASNTYSMMDPNATMRYIKGILLSKLVNSLPMKRN